MDTINEQRLAEAVAKLAALRAQKAERVVQRAIARDERLERACRVRFERVWPAGTLLTAAAKQMASDVVSEMTHDGRPAAMQMVGASLELSNAGVPYNAFVTLEDGRVACCSLVSPAFAKFSRSYLLALAAEQAAIAIEREDARKAAPSWGEDEDGQPRRPWWDRD
jgi:hypothetical protein